MTVKEKSIELYNKFRNEFPVLSANIRAKKCALICADEILKYLSDDGFPPEFEYWKEVKQEIKKL